jgi:hypothetical protein
MRHACKCGLSYRNPHDLDEHNRVGCRPQSSDGPTWSDKDVEETETIEEAVAKAVEEAAQEVSPEPEPQEKESSPCPQEQMST